MSRPLKRIGCVLLVGTLANCGGSIEGQPDDGAVGLPGETAGSGAVGTKPDNHGGSYIGIGGGPIGTCCPGLPPEGGYGGSVGIPDAGESFGGVGVGPGGEGFGGQVGVPPLAGAGGDDTIGIGGESGQVGIPPDNLAGQGGNAN